MKKFNIKKVIVSSLVAVLLLGAGITAGAAYVERWAGDTKVYQISQDLDTLDKKLTYFEKASDELINSLLPNHEPITISNRDSLFKKALVVAESNKQDTKRALHSLEDAERILGITDSSGKSISQRYTFVKETAQNYYNVLLSERNNLQADKTRLEGELATANGDKTEKDKEIAKKQQQIDYAEQDVKALKLKSKSIVENHGGTGNNDKPTITDVTQTPVK